jgi:ATP-binding cassette subfamily B protein RaxB
MLGIHPPTEGEVLVGGMRLKDLGLDAMRQMIGTVLQDDVLFAGSIAENISFFDPAADQAWIEECASLAAIHADIASTPMGYNTLVGEMGTVLSGGQKQRVLLARALYKRPKILFLDEATSHLDLEREQAVNASIKALNMTRIVIAHRPETIASADRVLTLRDGRIVEESLRATGNVLELRDSTSCCCAA